MVLGLTFSERDVSTMLLKNGSTGTRFPLQKLRYRYQCGRNGASVIHTQQMSRTVRVTDSCMVGMDRKWQRLVDGS